MNNTPVPTYLVQDAIYGILNGIVCFCLFLFALGMIALAVDRLRKSMQARRYEHHYVASVEPASWHPMCRCDIDALKQEADEYDELKAALFRQIDVILKEME